MAGLCRSVADYVREADLPEAERGPLSAIVDALAPERRLAPRARPHRVRATRTGPPVLVITVQRAHGLPQRLQHMEVDADDAEGRPAGGLRGRRAGRAAKAQSLGPLRAVRCYPCNLLPTPPRSLVAPCTAPDTARAHVERHCDRWPACSRASLLRCVATAKPCS
jgi:hypothetical protein